MITLEQWSDLLWTFVDEHFSKGRKFYFSIDDQRLCELGKQVDSKLATPDSCIESLAEACAPLFLGPEKFEVKNLAYQKRDVGYSASICLIAQQILAAERMISDEKGGSNKYYLRYRQTSALESQVGDESIPIMYESFERLWKTFRQELKSYKGATNQELTFGLGVPDWPVSGLNKYRWYPMSQSLLDAQSLNIIHSNINKIKQKSDVQLMRQIRPLRNKLTARSRSKLEKVYRSGYDKRAIENNVFTKDFVNQIKSYVPVPISSKRRVPIRDASQEKITVDQFRMYEEDVDDWDDLNGSSLVVYFRKAEDSQFSENQAAMAFNAYIASEKSSRGIFFYLRGGRYQSMRMDEAQGVSEYITHLLIKSSEKQALDLALRQQGVAPLRRETAEVPPGLTLVSCDGELWDFFKGDSSVEVNELEFRGGILINKVTNNYVSGFPPKDLYFENEKVASNEKIKVNGANRGVGEFLDRLQQERDRDFEIRYRDKSIRLAIETERIVEVPRLGNALDGSVVSIETTELKEQTYGLIHNVLNVPQGFLSQDEGTFGTQDQFLRDLYTDQRYWIPLKDDSIEYLLDYIDRVFVDNSKSRYWCSIIRQTRTVPPMFYRRWMSRVARQDKIRIAV